MIGFITDQELKKGQSPFSSPFISLCMSYVIIWNTVQPDFISLPPPPLFPHTHDEWSSLFIGLITNGRGRPMMKTLYWIIGSLFFFNCQCQIINYGYIADEKKIGVCHPIFFYFYFTVDEANAIDPNRVTHQGNRKKKDQVNSTPYHGWINTQMELRRIFFRSPLISFFFFLILFSIVQ